MSRRWISLLPVCAAAALLTSLLPSSAQAIRYLRVVDGELVQFSPSVEGTTNHFVPTVSGDLIEVVPGAFPGSEGSVEAIAAVVGWDQLAILSTWRSVGAGPGGTDIKLARGANALSSRLLGGLFYRVVDGALVVPDPLTPNTAVFAFTSVGIWVEIDPPRAVGDYNAGMEDLRRQFFAIEALIASGAPINPPPPSPEELLAREIVAVIWVEGGDLDASTGTLSSFGDHFYRVVDGKLVAQGVLWPNSGLFGRTQSGLLVELESSGIGPTPTEQLEAIEALIASGAPIIGPDGKEQQLASNGPVAVESATWGAVKAAFLR